MTIAMSETLRDFGVASAIVLGLAAFGIAGACFIRISLLTPRVDVLEDKATPSFAEELSEAKTDPEIPAVRTDTDGNGMPLALEQAKLEAERVEHREFVRSDGSTRTFEFRKPPEEKR